MIHFGTGNTSDVNTASLSSYERLRTTCPTDGYYSFAPYTYECFHNDWHTLTEDHTAGDVGGNMLLVNSSYDGGTFLKTTITGLKNNTIYEVGFYVMNLCRPTDKCPYPLLPNLIISIETPEGKKVASFTTGELTRVPQPKWSRYGALFTTPASAATLVLVMTNNVPGGCGNDFAIDDITFRECVKQNKPIETKKPVTQKTPLKKSTAPPQVIKQKIDTASKIITLVKPIPKIITPVPLILKTRENELVKRIETAKGEIQIAVYDNGEIDGDTVSIYHNNVLIRSHERLSQKPVSFTIGVNPAESHHEIIMVAENLGSIPPNTSVMIITTPDNRYRLMISSSEQKNAKVVLELKK